MAAETKYREAGGLPPTYRLDEINIRLTRHAGARADSTAQRISISGTGSATLEQDGRKMLFTYSSEDLLTMLNAFYKIKFFDLPTRYNLRQSVFLKEDGSIGTSVLRMVDTASTTVCFSIPNYEKCITYSSDGPRDLEELTQQIFAKANWLANASAPEE